MILSEDRYERLVDGRPMLQRHATPVKPLPRPLVGRDHELMALRAALARAELCNVILLAEAGAGKTALVQGAMEADADNAWVEIDVSSIVASLDDADELGNALKQLFREVADLGHDLERAGRGHGVVVFVDEFHQLCELSPSAVEALKPILADSGTRGIRVVGATTLAEFRQWVMPNQPLMERLQRLDLPELGHAETVRVLRSMADTYDVRIEDRHLLDTIVDYSERYVPSAAQPRKSIMLLDAMVGWHRVTGEAMDDDLLAKVIEDTTGNRVRLKIDASKIKETLDERVLAQQYATSAVEQRLQLSVADINDHSKPEASFLLAGSTGSGKALANDTLLPTIRGNRFSYRPAGDVRVGDFLFDVHGQPTEVEGVFPQGLREAYRITFSDQRSVVCSKDHLWTWCRRFGVEPGKECWRTTDLATIMDRGQTAREINAKVPSGPALVTDDVNLPCDPYVLGVFIGDGELTKASLSLASSSIFVADKVRRIIGSPEMAVYERENVSTKEERFYSGETWGTRRLLVQTVDVFGAVPEVLGKTASDKRIPRRFLEAGTIQRLRLLQGLMDSDGSIHDSPEGAFRYDVCYATVSERLADDVFLLCAGLGLAPTRSVNTSCEHAKQPLHVIWIHGTYEQKMMLFTRPDRVAIAERGLAESRSHRTRRYDMVGIDRIESIHERIPMSCFYVRSADHLFLTADGVATHNTELVKQVAKLLFGDDRRHLVMFDMSEFALDSSVDRFRRELTARVWERPFSVILLDEIEKAAGTVTRVLLQVLDDGRLTDENGRVVPFTNAYIFMTTNAGSEIYKTIAQYEASDTGAGDFVARYDKLIRDSLMAQGGKRFPPELLGRIDCIVPFQPLSEATKRAIVMMKLQNLAQSLWDRHSVRLSVDDRLSDYLVREHSSTDSDAGGAREIVASLTSEVSCAVARFINKYPHVAGVYVQVVGTMASEDKHLLKGDAHIEVVAARAE